MGLFPPTILKTADALPAGVVPFASKYRVVKVNGALRVSEILNVIPPRSRRLQDAADNGYSPGVYGGIIVSNFVSISPPRKTIRITREWTNSGPDIIEELGNFDLVQGSGNGVLGESVGVGFDDEKFTIYVATDF